MLIIRWTQSIEKMFIYSFQLSNSCALSIANKHKQEKVSIIKFSYSHCKVAWDLKGIVQSAECWSISSSCPTAGTERESLAAFRLSSLDILQPPSTWDNTEAPVSHCCVTQRDSLRGQRRLGFTGKTTFKFPNKLDIGFCFGYALTLWMSFIMNELKCNSFCVSTFHLFATIDVIFFSTGYKPDPLKLLAIQPHRRAGFSFHSVHLTMTNVDPFITMFS